MSSAATIPDSGTDISFGHLTALAWRIYKPNARLLILSFLTIVGAWAFLELLVIRGNRLGGLFNLILHLIFLVVSAGLQAGFLKMALKLNDGAPVEYRMLFSELRMGPKFLIAQIMVFVMVIVGMVFFLAPGIYFGARFGLFGTAIAERGVGSLESLSLSSRLTTGRRMELAILGVFMAVLNFFGAVFLGVGLLCTVPLSVLMVASVYRKLAGPMHDRPAAA
jgi:hypothetical protein